MPLKLAHIGRLFGALFWPLALIVLGNALLVDLAVVANGWVLLSYLAYRDQQQEGLCGD